MTKSSDKEFLYLFGIYFCNCGTLIVWYPDIKNKPNMAYFPELIECPYCKKSIPPCEKLFINPERDLVNEFLRLSISYNFKNMLMIDESHVHFIWNKPQKIN